MLRRWRAPRSLHLCLRHVCRMGRPQPHSRLAVLQRRAPRQLQGQLLPQAWQRAVLGRPRLGRAATRLQPWA